MSGSYPSLILTRLSAGYRREPFHKRFSYWASQLNIVRSDHPPVGREGLDGRDGREGLDGREGRDALEARVGRVG